MDSISSQSAGLAPQLPLWGRALAQCLLATVSLGVVLWFLKRDYSVVVASIGATAFIVFATPRSPAATARNVLGGHVIGLIAGGLWWLVPHTTPIAGELVYSAAVGTAILAMVLCGIRHPPAAGTALGASLTGLSFDAAVTVLVAITVMSVLGRLLRRQMTDLV